MVEVAWQSPRNTYFSGDTFCPLLFKKIFIHERPIKIGLEKGNMNLKIGLKEEK